jgi:hypothetical protein
MYLRVEHEPSKTAKSNRIILGKTGFFISIYHVGGKSNHFKSILKNAEDLFKVCLPRNYLGWLAGSAFHFSGRWT